MLSRKYAAPLRLELRPSLQVTLYLSAVHALALLAVALIPLPFVAMVGLVTCVLAGGLYTVRRHGLLVARSAITQIVWDREGRWWLTTRGQDVLECELARDSYLHPRAIVLSFRRARFARCAAVISGDRLDPETFRRLYVRLTIEGRTRPPT